MKTALCTLLLVLLAVSAFAAPPASWRVGTMVFYDASGSPFTHLLQFPGSPVDCTDNFSSDWCLWMNCNTVAASSYACADVPLVKNCLAVQIPSSGVARMIVDVDANACFK